MKVNEKEYQKLLDELKEIALQKGIKVRFEKGDFNGGYCILKSEKVIVINKLAQAQRKLFILVEALKEIGIEDIYINPKIRNIIENTSL
jgi:Zn-dependent peptidase ImmA (M78 family)